MDASPYHNLADAIEKEKVECLNAHPNHPVSQVLKPSNSVFYLKSDTDEQLLINIPFSSIVKIHHLVIEAPAADGKIELEADCAPKTVKIFINQMHMDFDEAESKPAVQELNLEPTDFGEVINLKFVKFQNVSNIILFVSENYGGSFTRINRIELHGAVLQSKTLGELKKVKEE